MRRLTDYHVLTFDCYGTLIDWETGIWDALQPLIMRNRDAGVSRDAALLAFGQCESLQERETPDLLYSELLARVHGRIADRLGMQTVPELDEAFGASVPGWPAFPDTADALRVLKRHFRLVILSNVHKDGIAGSNRKLGVEFDAIYTAEDIGSYKPADANFEYLVAHVQSDFGLDRSDILHTAQSLHHDHVPANRFGLANAWIDRQRLSEGGSWGATDRVETMPTTDFVFFSMGEMAAAVAACAGPGA
ncbi:MAG: haloacid dehalogenase [Holophagales bacterium]|nr:haloacid dehalogenase [Holophagales bacterium]MYF96924.1 haloacid dehalogenase [Holophagales bacterium]